MHTIEKENQRPQKSLLVAYFLWLFGGIFGLHHLYLNRDRHAFLWWCTLGGYFGLGWLSEVFLIPRYVRDANEGHEFMEKFKAKIRRNPKPPFSTIRFSGSIMAGFLFGELYQLAIPDEPFGGLDWTFLHWLIPLFISLGVWLVGNIGREKGSLWECLIAAYVVYPVRYYIYDETYSFTVVVFACALTFDSISKEWRIGPKKHHGAMKRTFYLSLAITLYLSLWCSYFYFNGKITDSEGDEVPVHEAIRNFLSSPWWRDLKQAILDTYNYGKHHGWYETWKEILDSLDVDGERNAYKVLGVSATASQTEITSAWRKLSKEFHPDKTKDATKRPEAQEKFMEIQQAYEILSKIKSRRRQRNKQFNDDL